jgi:N-dimethylarginine dimethylaminohydrolase
MTTQPTYLMTEATAFDVAYAINPWMKPDVWSADPTSHRRAALEGSAALRVALQDSGAVVHTVPAVDGQPDLVFPANAGIVLDGKALVARFRHTERRGEEPHFMAAFERLKDAGLLTDVAFIEDCYQEGAGDCIWDASRNLFWVGSGPRSAPESDAIIARHFGQQVVHLPLATEQFYHLDTCFCPLSGGEILYYPSALTAEARRRLRDLVPAHMLIEATAEDAAAFCVNAVSLNRTIVMATPPLALRDRLSGRGYDVLAVDLAPFILSGGGAFCMTLRLDLKSVVARAMARIDTELAA